MAAASVPLVGKKLMNQLGSMVNESAASEVSAFARRQMEKMGWTEGKGLGKQEQGMATYVRVKKREDLVGVGVERQRAEEQEKQWWYNVYDKVASKIQVPVDSDDERKAKKKKLKKEKKKKMKKLKQKKRSRGEQSSEEEQHAEVERAKEATKKRKRTAESSSEEEESDSITNQVDKENRARKYRPPTDEELFAATGGKLFGRRAYGSCTGKLKRDQMQVAGKLASGKCSERTVKSEAVSGSHSHTAKSK